MYLYVYISYVEGLGPYKCLSNLWIRSAFGYTHPSSACLHRKTMEK